MLSVSGAQEDMVQDRTSGFDRYATSTNGSYERLRIGCSFGRSTFQQVPWHGLRPPGPVIESTVVPCSGSASLVQSSASSDLSIMNLGIRWNRIDLG